MTCVYGRAIECMLAICALLLCSWFCITSSFGQRSPSDLKGATALPTKLLSCPNSINSYFGTSSVLLPATCLVTEAGNADYMSIESFECYRSAQCAANFAQAFTLQARPSEQEAASTTLSLNLQLSQNLETASETAGVVHAISPAFQAASPSLLPLVRSPRSKFRPQHYFAFKRVVIARQFPA